MIELTFGELKQALICCTVYRDCTNCPLYKGGDIGTVSAGWARDEGRSEFGEDAKWDIYKNLDQNIISIDTCTAYTGKVAVLVIEDNFLNKEGT